MSQTNTRCRKCKTVCRCKKQLGAQSIVPRSVTCNPPRTRQPWLVGGNDGLTLPAPTDGAYVLGITDTGDAASADLRVETAGCTRMLISGTEPDPPGALNFESGRVYTYNAAVETLPLPATKVRMPDANDDLTFIDLFLETPSNAYVMEIVPGDITSDNITAGYVTPGAVNINNIFVFDQPPTYPTSLPDYDYDTATGRGQYNTLPTFASFRYTLEIRNNSGSDIPIAFTSGPGIENEFKFTITNSMFTNDGAGPAEVPAGGYAMFDFRVDRQFIRNPNAPNAICRDRFGVGSSRHTMLSNMEYPGPIFPPPAPAS